MVTEADVCVGGGKIVRYSRLQEGAENALASTAAKCVSVGFKK